MNGFSLPRVNELMEKYEACEKCGSGHVGNGAGTLFIDDKSFKRTCKCGWEVEIDVQKDIKPND